MYSCIDVPASHTSIGTFKTCYEQFNWRYRHSAEGMLTLIFIGSFNFKYFFAISFSFIQCFPLIYVIYLIFKFSFRKKNGYNALNFDQESTKKVIAFLGFTGSGKSTAVKFILKDPSLEIEEYCEVCSVTTFDIILLLFM